MGGFFCVFFFKQKTAYDIRLSLVGSEMCIRDKGLWGRRTLWCLCVCMCVCAMCVLRVCCVCVCVCVCVCEREFVHDVFVCVCVAVFVYLCAIKV